MHDQLAGTAALTRQDDIRRAADTSARLARLIGQDAVSIRDTGRENPDLDLDEILAHFGPAIAAHVRQGRDQARADHIANALSLATGQPAAAAQALATWGRPAADDAAKASAGHQGGAPSASAQDGTPPDAIPLNDVSALAATATHWPAGHGDAAAPAKPDTAAGSSPAIPDQPFPYEPGDEAQDRQRLVYHIGDAPPPKDNWEEYKEAFAKTPTGRFITGIGNALTLPGRVYSREPVDLTDGYGYDELARRQQQDIEDATNLAGFAGGGAPMVAAGRQTMGALARRAVAPEAERVLSGNIEGELAAGRGTLYDPPVKPLRPFEADYPNGAPVDTAGNLLADIEGRQINPGALVIGRRTAGGLDEAARPEDLDALTEAIMGALPKSASRGALSGNSGQYLAIREGGDVIKRARYADDLTLDQIIKVIAHELSHGVNDLAGTIPDAPYMRRIANLGKQDDLRRIYNDLNTPPDDWRMVRQERTGEPVANKYRTSPETMDYPKREVPSELIAEAIRAYLADPNYLKTVAPQTAALIRKAVNTNPRLSPYLQFNSAAPPPLGAILGLNTDQDEPSSPLLDVMAPRRQ